MKKLLITTLFATFALSASAAELPKECLEVKEVVFAIAKKENRSMDDTKAFWANMEQELLADLKKDPKKVIEECKMAKEMLEQGPQQ